VKTSLVMSQHALSSSFFASKPTTSSSPKRRPATATSSRRVASRDNRVRAGLFEDILDSVLPKPMSDARKQMEYFDGPGGMLAKINPLAKKPTMKAPEVSAGKSSQVLFDFTSMSQDEFKSEFGALNDNVMGGRSDALTVLESGKCAVLKGMTEDQFGGFASMKSRDFDRAINLQEFDGVSVRCKGDGQRYKLILYDTDDSFNVAFHQTFECPRGNFEDVKLYFKDFKPVQRGRLVLQNESEYRLCDGSKVLAVQLMLSKFSYGMDDKNTNYKPGAFDIEVERIEAFKD